STSGLEQVKLNCGVFFGGEDAWVEQYCAWCDDFSSESKPELADDLRQLVRYSLAAAQPLQRRTREAAEQMRILAERWRLEWQHLEDERLDFIRVSSEQAPACKAIVFRQKRLVEEYLLRELATQGYLPAYGFPSHIAAFDNMTVDRFKARKAAAESREDNRYQRRDLASRDVVTALREYAPGAEVVMNGLVYRSAGITLNWKIPPDAEHACETQEIRSAWRCKKCGASGSSRSRNMVGTCSSCSQEIEKGNILEFLEPAGFAVDFFSKPDNDINVQQFVPVESPWINAGGEWTCLANPELGRFRITTTGHIFHHSRGIHGEGYALCLACGRAEPMMPGGELPKKFQTPHRKLRRAKDEDSFCSASDYSVKQGISLGHELRTDMLELQLKNNAGVWLDDYVAARTIAVALRDSLAELIGVQAIELGCEVKQSKPEHESIRQSILIYDTHAAGYASRAEGMFDVLFKEAHRKLCCQKECDSACPHCVLDFDQRFALEHLDRHDALKWFDEAWLNSLQLPEEYAFFGSTSFPEYKKISEAIRYAVSRCGCTGVRCYTGGASDTWEIAVSSLRALTYGLAGQDIAVEIVLPEQLVSELDTIDRTILAGMADHPHISFFTSNEVLRAGKGYIVAETVGGTVHTRWAGRDISSLAFNSDWGRGEHKEDFLVRSDNEQPAVALGTALSPDALRPVMTANSDCVLNVHQELNGSIRNFGLRFWKYLLQQHPASKELFDEESNHIIAVRYSDRYIKNPITAALFSELICGLKNLVGEKRWTQAALSLVSMNIQPNRYEKPQTLIWHDWQENQYREKVIKELLMSCNVSDISLFNRDMRQIEHRRSLMIEFSPEKRLDIFFDQGLSYWQSAKSIPFDFSQSPEQQCHSILQIIDNESSRIKGSDLFPTVLSIRQKG
ncbi:MAG: DUF1998 domain-containing protein, partial [Candidatus Electrothrix sp. ATG1]|nr:DUF1998 domain-containing protein [Candidatus Electrothrix sp. ATG1]